MTLSALATELLTDLKAFPNGVGLTELSRYVGEPRDRIGNALFELVTGHRAIRIGHSYFREDSPGLVRRRGKHERDAELAPFAKQYDQRVGALRVLVALAKAYPRPLPKRALFDVAASHSIPHPTSLKLVEVYVCWLRKMPGLDRSTLISTRQGYRLTPEGLKTVKRLGLPLED